MKTEKMTAAWQPSVAQYGLVDVDPARMRIHRYEKGEFLCRAGERIPDLLLITAGKVRVAVTGFNGKSLLYGINVNRGFMGCVELMTGAAATASAEALTAVTCIAVPIAENLKTLTGSLPFMNALCMELSVVFESSSRSSAQNILYPLETRLCSYIAMTQEKAFFAENLTDLHALLGTSYRHLLRTLESLCKRSVLQKRAGGYAIADFSALQRIARGYYSL